MSYPFDPARGPIYVEAEFSGPTGRSSLRLLLDTGATTSLIDTTMLVAVGYDPAASPDRVRVTLGSGVEHVPRPVLNRFAALGLQRVGFPVLSRSLPAEAGVDGLLGLDFLRGQMVALDFRVGMITIT